MLHTGETLDDAMNLARKVERLQSRQQQTPSLQSTANRLTPMKTRWIEGKERSGRSPERPQRSTTAYFRNTRATETRNKGVEGRGKEKVTGKSDITCFKCREKGHRSSECPQRKFTGYTHPEGDDDDDDQQEFSIEEVGDEDGGEPVLVVRRLLYTHASQRQQIFEGKCTVAGKIFRMIIDSGSCENLVSQQLVDLLKLQTRPHPHPYGLGWIKRGPRVEVTK